MEILIALAYQVYTLGLSLDKACQVLGFFQNLSLKKSQANALLNQLARVWEHEFDTLCMLLANSAVVYCDETVWSINSVWAFLLATTTARSVNCETTLSVATQVAPTGNLRARNANRSSPAFSAH